MYTFSYTIVNRRGGRGMQSRDWSGVISMIRPNGIVTFPRSAQICHTRRSHRNPPHDQNGARYFIYIGLHAHNVYYIMHIHIDS